MAEKSDLERYLAAAHAMQSGVAARMSIDHPMNIDDQSPATSPKHLRVGVNSAMCDHAALVRLLIAKGVFTEAEYHKEIADEMEREQARYERELSEHYGKSITLA